MKKKTARRLFNIFAPVGIGLMCALTLGNKLAWANSSMVSKYLGQDEDKKVTKDGSEINKESSKYYKSDYKKLKQVQKDETTYSQDVQAEGTVLLQNKGLPIKESGKVTILGYSCTKDNFLVGGGGSGAIDTSNTPTLQEVFETAGYSVNPTMWDFYTTGNGKATYSASDVVEPALSKYSDKEFSSFKEYNDAAIVVISRKGAEGTDLVTSTKSDSTKSMLEFSDNELGLINRANQDFEKVVVLLNTMNPMELGSLENLEHVSVLWIGAGGQQGLRAIPEVLNGVRYPSGKLVDTYSYDVFSSPAMSNFGDYNISNGGKYVNYAENIYVGYKYYETRYFDKIMGKSNVGDYDYSSTVQYPFGYGLTYATFEYSNFQAKDNGDSIDFSVKVSNTSTSDVAGKEVVEIYMSSPYTSYDIENGVEKSAVELVGFAKTDELEQGMEQTVTISVSKESLKTYDSKKQKGYIVDEGNYYFTLGSDAHDATNNVLAKLGKTTSDGMDYNGNANFVYTYTQSTLDTTTYATESGTIVTNQFDDCSYKTYFSSFNTLTRNDWNGTFPTTPSNVLEASDKLTEAMKSKTIEDDKDAVMPTTGKQNDVVLADLIGKDYDDSLWDSLLDELTADEMNQLLGNAGYGTISLSSIGKPSIIDKDGPAGISSTLIGGIGCFGFATESVLGSTWNLSLAEKMGYFVGEDSLYSGVSGWYAPGANIHRTPFGGRNFEYYSEDSLLSGEFAASVIKEARKKGVYCYLKHFALNDQETNRSLLVTFAEEQAIREIYLKPFEIAVKEGECNAIMVAMNRVGPTWVGSHKGLVNNVLRDEWGFKGIVITDAAMTYIENLDMRAALASGTDMWLCPTNNLYTVDTSNATNVQNLRRSTHRLLYVIANSNAMNGIDPNVRIVAVTPAWKIWLIVIDVVIYGGMSIMIVGSLVFWLIGSRKEKKEGNENA